MFGTQVIKQNLAFQMVWETESFSEASLPKEKEIRSVFLKVAEMMSPSTKVAKGVSLA